MLYFDYTGISSGKYVTGEIQALNQEEAAFKLKNNKIIITKLIQSKKKVVGEKKVVRSVKREKNAEEVVEVVSDVAEEEEIREFELRVPKKSIE